MIPRRASPAVRRLFAQAAHALAVATWSRTDEDHPAIRAAAGRVLAYEAVPQRGSTTPEAVAWHRETGADPGYMNRTARKKQQTNHVR